MDQGLEYLFFTAGVSERFKQALQARHIVWQESEEGVHGARVIKISEHIDDAVWDELDELFDELSIEDQQLMEAGIVDVDAHSTAGIYLQLSNGQQTIAQVDPDMVRRILSVLSVEELNTFLEVIVRSVEQPDDSAICAR